MSHILSIAILILCVALLIAHFSNIKNSAK